MFNASRFGDWLTYLPPPIYRWTRPDFPDFKWCNIYESETNNFLDAEIVGHTVSNRFTRDGLPNGAERWIWITTVDRSGNESAKYPASNTGGVYAKTTRLVNDDIGDGEIADGKHDQTTPGAPGTPSLASAVADYDRDNKLDSGLSISFTAPGSGRTPKKYLVEIYRSTSIGTTNSLSGYTLWKDFTTHKLSTSFRANTRFYHKAVVTPITTNDVQGTASAATAVGVQPAAPSLTLSAATSMGANIFSHGFYLSWTDPTLSGSNFDHTEVEIQGNSSGVWEFLGYVETNHFYYPNRYATIQARICHVDSFGNKTAKYTSTTFTGNLIQLAEMDTNSIGRSQIIDGEVIFSKLAANVFANGNAALNVGDLGSSAWLKKTSTGTANAGDLVAGGNLVYSDSSLTGSTNPSGTWECRGRCPSGQASEWVRKA